MGAKSGDPFTLVFFVAIFAIFYFLIILPSQKKQKHHQELLKSLKKGDKVVIQGGIHGEITKVKDTVIHLKIADKTEIVVDKPSVIGVKKKEEGKSKKS
jgi:preprotein translocase subunit YajC